MTQVFVFSQAAWFDFWWLCLCLASYGKSPDLRRKTSTRSIGCVSFRSLQAILLEIWAFVSIFPQQIFEGWRCRQNRITWERLFFGVSDRCKQYSWRYELLFRFFRNRYSRDEGAVRIVSPENVCFSEAGFRNEFPQAVTAVARRLNFGYEVARGVGHTCPNSDLIHN